MNRTVWNRIVISFLDGIVTLIPIVITVAIVKFVVLKVNSIVLSPLLKLFSWRRDNIEHIFMAKTIILVGVIIAIILIGWAARQIVVRRIFAWWEQLFLRVPGIGWVYKTVKEVSNALFGGQGKYIFKSAVLIEFPRKGLYSIAFVTDENPVGELCEAVGEKVVSVFMPTAPNPTTGFTLILPRGEVKFLKMSVEDAMKIVISGGAVTPAALKVSGE
ncbi:MAG TPA: DUF502 domain-containing protein [Candidatus Omnitrophota bacterium]|nr:DUF502 domain-containing protein [Candidatus Omnitrophota bacterium]